MAVAMSRQNARAAPALPVRTISRSDLSASLSEGLNDFLSMRGDLIFVGLLYLLYRTRLQIPLENRRFVLEMDAKSSIRDWPELKRTGPVLVATILAAVQAGDVLEASCEVVRVGRRSRELRCWADVVARADPSRGASAKLMAYIRASRRRISR